MEILKNIGILPDETEFLIAKSELLKICPCEAGVDDTKQYPEIASLYSDSRNDFEKIRALEINTRERMARMYHSKSDGTWKNYFSSLEIDLEALAFETKEQIREFVFCHYNAIYGPWYEVTFFLVKTAQANVFTHLYPSGIMGCVLLWGV